MDRYTATLVPSSTRTRMLLTQGPDELMRAVLPPPPSFYRDRPVGTVASQLAGQEEVVRRVLGLLDRARPAPRPRPRLVDPFVDVIGETLSRYPRLRSTRLCDMLKARGYTGSPRTLRTYVAA